MKERQPTWPRMAFMLLPAAVMATCCYLLSNRRENVGGAVGMLAVLAAVSFAAFFVALYLVYLRPQYGRRAFLHLIFFLLGHGILVLLMWRVGVLG